MQFCLGYLFDLARHPVEQSLHRPKYSWTRFFWYLQSVNYCQLGSNYFSGNFPVIQNQFEDFFDVFLRIYIYIFYRLKFNFTFTVNRSFTLTLEQIVIAFKKNCCIIKHCVCQYLFSCSLFGLSSAFGNFLILTKELEMKISVFKICFRCILVYFQVYRLQFRNDYMCMKNQT